MRFSKGLLVPIFAPYIDAAFTWLCQTRNHHSPNSDCWDLRFHWTKRRQDLCTQLQQHRYQFSPLQQYRLPTETLTLYSSSDCLILKTLSLALTDYFQKNKTISPHCHHFKGHGGIKAAVNQTKNKLNQFKFVFKSDIKGYYEHIDHDALCTEIYKMTQDEYTTALIRDSLKAPSHWGGLYYDRKRGIPRASPLSPLLGAIALNPLDCAMQKIKGIFYARFMDDWIVLCKTKYQLRKVIKITHQILNQLKLSLHPDKTTIGKIENEFDFLGFHFASENLSVAKACVNKAISKMQQLYEQGATLKRLVDYRRRFLQWVKSVSGAIWCATEVVFGHDPLEDAMIADLL